MIVLIVDLGGLARGIFIALLAPPGRGSLLRLPRHSRRLPAKEVSTFLGTTSLYETTPPTPVQG